MAFNCKNYETDGGNKWVVGGTLKIEEGATLEGMASATTAPATSETLGLVKVGANVDVSAQGAISVKTASGANKGVVQIGDGLAIANGVVSLDAPDAGADVKGVVLQGVAVADAEGEAPTAAEFKALLDSLRDAGIIATAEA